MVLLSFHVQSPAVEKIRLSRIPGGSGLPPFGHQSDALG